MKDCFFQYRKALYDALKIIQYRGETLPVMEYAPDGWETPYLQIINMSSRYERDDDAYSQWVQTEIMVVTSHPGPPDDFVSKLADDIMTVIMQRLIYKGVTEAAQAKFMQMDDFTDNGAHFVSLRYDNDFDGAKTTIRKLLTIETLIDEISTLPLTADNTEITVDSTEITVDATLYI